MNTNSVFSFPVQHEQGQNEAIVIKRELFIWSCSEGSRAVIYQVCIHLGIPHPAFYLFACLHVFNNSLFYTYLVQVAACVPDYVSV